MIYFLDDCAFQLNLYASIFPNSRVFAISDALYKALEIEQPDIFVCDLILTDEDGWTVASRVHELYPKIKIVIATANKYSTQKDYAEIKGYTFWHKSSEVSLRSVINSLEV
jgi:CheY-like chemotaxis protein